MIIFGLRLVKLKIYFALVWFFYPDTGFSEWEWNLMKASNTPAPSCTEAVQMGLKLLEKASKPTGAPQKQRDKCPDEGH